MNGEQLLQKLQVLTPEQRQHDVVVEGEDGWLYGASDLRICKEHHGKEDEKGTDTIVITNNF